MKPETVINLRLKKFSVGHYNAKLGICENAWIEIRDYDSDEMNDETDQKEMMRSNHQALNNNNNRNNNNAGRNKRGLISKLMNRKNYEKVFFSERNLTLSGARNFYKPGRYCGSLSNFLSNYYSFKKYIVINYFHLIDANDDRESENGGAFHLSDTFEFEISFYSKESLEPKLFAKQKYLTNPNDNHRHLESLNYNYGQSIESTKCNRLFANCSSPSFAGCIISSPGFPGIYLKNLKCLYLIKSSLSTKANYLNQKLILINDNLQLDGTMCHHTESAPSSSSPLLSRHYSASSTSSSSSSYFCDNGLRQSRDCKDHLNVYDGMALTSSLSAASMASSSQLSLVLMKRLCGMGRMPKVVTSKNALVLELNTGSDGLFANTGFLFYAMNQKQYFENYNIFNQLDKSSTSTGSGSDSNHLARTQVELSSIRVLERLQIENCDSDMNTCTIQIGDDTINQIVSLSSSQISNSNNNNRGSDETTSTKIRNKMMITDRKSVV